MEFTFLHAGLAAGAALAAIPVILHLILRQKPRHEMFPALRLIRQRHRVNLRKLRIRHWLLLAMRMLLIALMALALARPSIHGATFIPDQQAPVAAAMVFDTSLSMEYQVQGKSRLEEAKAIAKNLIKEFPDGSEALVLDSAEPQARFFPELSLVQQRIESLRPRPRATSLNQTIVEACRGLTESDRTRKEIYVFTDLATGSFSVEGATEIQAALGSVKEGVAVYLLNVGVAETKNAFISDAAPSAEVLPANSDARVRVTVEDAGQGEEVLVEFLLDKETRGTQQLALEKGRAARAEFPLPRLKPGIYQGTVVLRNGGGLKFDDERFLAIEVRPETRVLIVSDVARDGELLDNALAPELLIQQQRSRHKCERILTSRLADKRLADYDVVCLVNVQDLPVARWADLNSFAMAGGGVGVFLGSRVQSDNYNQEVAQDLLPVKLDTVATPKEPVGMKAPAPGHPVVKKIHEWDDAALGQVIVERYIRTELSAKNARRVIDFTDGSIAFAERTMGGARPGRVVVCTTAVNFDPRAKDWNDLRQFDVLFVPLMDNLVNHLAGHAEQQLNYQVGQDVMLRLDRGQKVGPYLLHSADSPEPTRRTPDAGKATNEPDSNTSSDGGMILETPESLGHYRIAGGQGDQAFQKVFSVNPNAAESRLEPLSATELTAVFGEGNYAVARTADELREVMGDVRIGRELYPWLMPLLVLIFAVEHVLANRFYKQAESGERRAESQRKWDQESRVRNQESQTVSVG
jgi:hypothetical protein